MQAESPLLFPCCHARAQFGVPDGPTLQITLSLSLSLSLNPLLPTAGGVDLQGIRLVLVHALQKLR